MKHKPTVKTIAREIVSKFRRSSYVDERLTVDLLTNVMAPGNLLRVVKSCYVGTHLLTAKDTVMFVVSSNLDDTYVNSYTCIHVNFLINSIDGVVTDWFDTRNLDYVEVLTYAEDVK